MGFTAELNGYEPVDASLDFNRRGSEPGKKRLAQELAPVSATVGLVIGKLRAWDYKPGIWGGPHGVQSRRRLIVPPACPIKREPSGNKAHTQ